MNIPKVIWTDFSWMDFSLNLCLKSTFILILSLLFVRFFSKISGKHRYQILKGTFVFLLLIPLTAWLPSVSFYTNSQYIDAQQIIEELPVPYEVVLEKNKSESELVLSSENAEVPFSSFSNQPFNYQFWFFFIWSVGFIIFIIPIFLEIFYLKKIVLKQDLTDKLIPNSWQSILQSSQQQIDIHFPIQLIISKKIKVPSTFGWKKTFILMPEEALSWDDDKIKTVFLHELGHIYQKDFRVNLFIQFIKTIYWWHPLVWWATKETRMACEYSCDELVLQTGVSHFNYAQHLVEIARSIHLPRFQYSLTTISITQNSQLKKRVGLILQNTNTPFYNNRFTFLKYLVFLTIPLFFLNFNYSKFSSPLLSEQNLIQQLSNSNSATQIEAAKMLGELQSNSAFAPLVKTLKNKNPQVRVAAAWALGKIQNKDAVAELLPLVQDQNDCVKEWALLSLGEFGALKSFHSVVETQGDANPEIRKATLWSLHQIGCLPAFHHISQHLDDENKEVRFLANQLLEDFPKEKLRAWVSNRKDKRYNDWVYEHFSGIKKLGKANLFVARLGKDENERVLLSQTISKEHTIKVLDEIWEILK